VRFLADANIPRAVVQALAKRGHDVTTIGDVDRGAGDHQIVARAAREGRVLLAFDKDFGAIAFRSVRSPTCGVISLRFVPRDPEEAVAVVAAAIAMRDDWTGQFAVVERDRLRGRRLRRSLRDRSRGDRREEKLRGDSDQAALGAGDRLAMAVGVGDRAIAVDQAGLGQPGR
jgi:predicted nuclease of predicted toxin-antitoxin system